MGYRIKQQTLSGQESSGGHNLVVVEVDAVADFASLPTYQDGSVGYIRGNPDALYIKDTTWKLIDKSALAEGRQIEIDGINPFALMLTFKLLQGKLATLAAASQLASTAMQPDEEQSRYYILDALPTTTAELFEGKIVYNTTDQTLQVCTTPGEHESDKVEVETGPVTKTGLNDITITFNEDVVVEVNGGTLDVHNATITAGATANGNLTITLNGVPATVAVVAEDTAAQVAEKITTAYAENAHWTVGNESAVLTFTAKAVGPKAGAFTFAAAATGVTCTAGITETTPGVAADTAIAVATKIKEAVDAAVVAGDIDPWMVTRDGAELNFLKGAVGTASAPSAVDTDDTGVTFSAFTQTNVGAASVWGTLINIS